MRSVRTAAARLVEAGRAVSRGTRHLTARNPIGANLVYGAAYTVVFFAIVRSFTVAVPAGATVTVIALYHWRPGGRSRRGYELWALRFDHAERVDGVAVAGWYFDPLPTRHALRYWDGREWTGYVVDTTEIAFDPVPATPA